MTVVAALLLVSACGKDAGAEKGSGKADKAPAETRSVTIQDEDIVVTSWVSEASPDENVSHLKDATFLSVGSSGKGTKAVGLARFALPSGITPDDVEKATLSLKPKKGSLSGVRVAAVTKKWAFAEADWNTLKDAFGVPAAEASATPGENGLLEADVTGIVKSWLGADTDNYGFSLTGVKDGETAEFYSAGADNVKDFPALTITYRSAVPAEKYGRFDYAADKGESGNCFSYALRHNQGIYLKDLGVDEKTLANEYLNGGEDKALEYFKGKALAYIDEHKAELNIDSWRELKGIGDKIDPEKEYIVVMKIGFADGIKTAKDFDIDKDFDFHFRARLSDGTWAEKMGSEPSRVIPGSNPAYDASKYPWDSNYLWGYSKWNGFYKSKPVYLAVTKTA
jgi:hypothetical protein